MPSLSRGLAILAKADPERLLAAAQNLSPSRRIGLLTAAGRAKASHDFPAAVSWALQQPDKGVLMTAAVGAAPNGKAAVSALMSGAPNARRRWRATSARFSPSAIRAALEAVAALERGEEGGFSANWWPPSAPRSTAILTKRSDSAMHSISPTNGNRTKPLPRHGAD